MICDTLPQWSGAGRHCQPPRALCREQFRARRARSRGACRRRGGVADRPRRAAGRGGSSMCNTLATRKIGNWW